MEKKLFFILVGMIIGFVVPAQNVEQSLRDKYPDTLVLEMESKKELTFLFDRISNRKEYVSEELWGSLLTVMETAVERSDLEKALRVTYRNTGPGNKVIIEVKAIEQKSTITIDQDGMREVLWSRIDFEVLFPEVVILFSINELEELSELKELDISSVWKGVEERYSNEGKVNLYKGNGTIKYGKAQIEAIEATSPQDNLSIDFLGLGLGFYRDRFVPDLGSKLTFNMHNRLGDPWISFGALYTRQFFFNETESGDFDLDQNGFLSGFFKVTTRAKNEFGIGLGGLIHREGNFYQGSTYKMSFYFARSADTKFTYSPEFVFTNDFKSIFPAFRVGLSF